ncbi:MAG: anaerobic ribonucleoside-triphosphate reductase activating protein [Bacilli bacterium]
MNITLASAPYFDSIVDGPGIRAVLFTQGCPHNCKGCHNPHTHALDAGIAYSTDAVIAELKQSVLQSGLTISGGEPLLQAHALIPIATWAKQNGWSIWLYTGYTFEYLLQQRDSALWSEELFALLDVVVDGPFIEAKKDLTLLYRGSSNQRILDWQKSIASNRPILFME